MAGFSIQLEFIHEEGVVNEEQKCIFWDAARRWEAVIVSGPASQAQIDLHILIVVLETSDHGIQRQGLVAGPTKIHRRTGLPIEGRMVFDEAMLRDLEYGRYLNNAITHHIGHVLGIGTLWKRQGLVTCSDTNNPIYIGPKAVQEYSSLLDEIIPQAAVPLSNCGALSKQPCHWQGSTFGNELMTGKVQTANFSTPSEETEAILHGNPKLPLSRLSVAALEDLGYICDYSKADVYKLPHIDRTNHHATAKKSVESEEQEYQYCLAQFPTAHQGKRCCCLC